MVMRPQVKKSRDKIIPQSDLPMGQSSEAIMKSFMITLPASGDYVFFLYMKLYGPF